MKFAWQSMWWPQVLLYCPALGCLLDTWLSSRGMDNIPSVALDLVARTALRFSIQSLCTDVCADIPLAFVRPKRLCSFSLVFSSCHVSFGLGKCHQNVQAMILQFHLFLWHNCKSSESVLHRGKACDIFKQTKIVAFAESGLLLTKRPRRWERQGFQLKVKWTFLSSSQHRMPVFILTGGFGDVGAIKIPWHVQSGFLGAVSMLYELGCQRNKNTDSGLSLMTRDHSATESVFDWRLWSLIDSCSNNWHSKYIEKSENLVHFTSHLPNF